LTVDAFIIAGHEVKVALHGLAADVVFPQLVGMGLYLVIFLWFEVDWALVFDVELVSGLGSDMAKLRTACWKNDAGSFNFTFHEFIDPGNFFVVLSGDTGDAEVVSEL
jgi:hypothetical protein